jgi:hypothetical protein
VGSGDLRALTPCAMCESALSTRTGEHVLPRNLLRKRFPLALGPYTTTSPRGITTDEKFDAVKLACCRACNDRLNERFEDLTAEPVMRLLTQDEPSLDAAQTRLAALWFLKTWSLLSHPRSEYQPSTPAPTVRWHGVPQSVWSWTVQDEDPPAGLSAWAFRHRQEGDGSESSPTARLELPRVVADDMDQQFYVHDLTLERINVSVVWHPGWPIEHPAAAAGEAMRLWPLAAGATIDRLPELHQRPIRWATGPVLRFLPDTYDGTLPPLTPGVPPASQVMDRLESGSA